MYATFDIMDCCIGVMLHVYALLFFDLFVKTEQFILNNLLHILLSQLLIS